MCSKIAKWRFAVIKYLLIVLYYILWETLPKIIGGAIKFQGGYRFTQPTKMKLKLLFKKLK